LILFVCHLLETCRLQHMLVLSFQHMLIH
jgi:hypothetical protein